ncbi:MAG: type IV pilus assembly protein PilM [Candidatus Nealsonbacteria bacterium]|nr:type IV pilus assembly protein PilM [Candidatus Nealsonbacteria bacterium]
MEFLSLKSKAFGMDFSDLSIKVANLKKRGRFFKLVSWGETLIEPGIISEGEIKNEDKVVEAVKKALKSIKGKKIKESKVVVSLPEKKAFLVVIKMPKLTKEELKTAVYFEAENHIPFKIEDVYLDFEVIPSLKGYLGENINVLVAAIPKKIVDSYVSCIKKAGLSPMVLEIESQAISRALIRNNVSASPVLIVDFGKSRTSFIIYSGQSISFTSSVPFSSSMLTEAVGSYLNIGSEEAEKIKIEYGLSNITAIAGKSKKTAKKGNEQNSQKAFEAMIPILTDLSEQMKKAIYYYEGHESNGKSLGRRRTVEKILLSGRGSNLKGLIDFLSANFKIPIELANPWINILPAPLKEIPELPFTDSLGFTAVLGLALRGTKLDSE